MGQAQVSIEFLIGVSTLYLGLITIMFGVLVQPEAAPYLSKPMRYLRLFTTLWMAKLAVELALAYGPLILHVSPEGTFLKLDMPLGQGLEAAVGAVLVVLLWNTRPLFYELEQISQSFDDL